MMMALYQSRLNTWKRMPVLELPNGYYQLPPGKLANVATRLEMRERPERELLPFPKDLHLQPAVKTDVLAYRNLFRAVGQDLLWFSRHLMSDEKLLETLSDKGTESFTLKRGDDEIGILELSFRDLPECELSFFGLVPNEIGKGTGRALMDEAIRRAFARPISRIWLSTCTFDHPKALDFYRKSGFTPYARLVEIHDDPRLQGKLPPDAASQIPLLP
jgi:GNAT superfamily N-acetyltransferase